MHTLTVKALRSAAGLLLSTVMLTASLKAQVANPWQVELGAFGTGIKYDSDNAALASKFGAGGRLGLFLSRIFSLEASGDYTQTEESVSAASVNVSRLRGTLYANTRPTMLGRVYLGAGYSRLYYRGATDGEDNGMHLVLGDLLSLGGRTAFRIEGLMEFLPSSVRSLTNSTAINFGAAAGLSIFAFGGPPRDSDRDRVANKIDECPDTPYGASVDQQGCPLDGDIDGVFDGLDQCPDTPSGAFVDALGCPSDTDDDGVFDGVDVCPNTPAAAEVDPNGCPTDGDADGVFDGLDQCPNTPRGATVDTDGCPSDSDRDGVFDGIDQCPATPFGMTVDEQGCPTDADGDGVVNDLDQCPNTPPGAEVDATGCTIERDTDGDGIPDGRDRCPNTAPGQNVDAVGCPILFQISDEGVAQPLVLRGVNFETGRSALTQDSYAILNEVAASLLANADVRVEVAGHTDITGPMALNQRLSLERAQAVKAYLARQGVEPSRMVARGYGPDEPIATNATVAGRAQNRRVELKLLEEAPRQ
jgi:outer membrane protein OmpA-like peptidoglycan-associated protein